jgi:hypothetical protein
MNNEYLEKYAKEGFHLVNGFCPKSCLEVLDYLDVYEQKSGGAMEIGVHHGQFFIALNQLIPSTFTSYAIDLFDNQDLNIDKSGEGNKLKFLENLKKFDRHGGRNVQELQADSTDQLLFNNIGRFHYISVDGGHMVEHVINDLTIAQQLVTQNGIVILDDYFNHWWPSVTEGVLKFLNTSPTLVPFATSENKMWLCKLSYHKKYVNYINTIPSFNKTKTSIVGNEIIDLWR